MIYHVAFGSFDKPGDRPYAISPSGWHCLARWRGVDYRSYAGPYVTKAEAEKAAADLEAAMAVLFEQMDKQ